MPLLGAHMSIAGGYYKAVDAAASFGMDTCQLFTKNNNQWRGKPLSDDDVRLFREALDRTGIQRPCGHNSYLINVASPDDVLWQRSLDALVEELQRAERLGLAGLVMHPGSFVASTPEAGLERIARALDDVHRATKGFQCQLWLELTAGQGSCLGCRFEEIAWLLEHVRQSDRLGVCVDTCHIFAAGYPLATEADCRRTLAELDRVIGLDRVRAFHLNDSKKGLGSRVDRHEHIGEGCIGLDAFRFLLNDKRLREMPMYLETKKETRGGEEMDAVNMRTLRSLTAAPPAKAQAKRAAPRTSRTARR
ncbi:MAG: deoxyribonuclease IV [Planctomyces sp.]|nr:deoxyribonuclease IV [Planctomyces sp.]